MTRSYPRKTSSVLNTATNKSTFTVTHRKKIAKKNLRATLKQQRQKATPLQRKLNSHAQLTRLKQLSVYKKSKRIAFYWSMPDEADTLLFLKYALKQQKQCFLPCIEPNGTMTFRRYRFHRTMHKNKFNIPEPRFGKKYHARNMQCVLTPLLGIDTHGIRIGMGGGYYDRTFSFLKRKRSSYLIGIALTGLEKKRIDKDTWDIKLNGALHYQSYRNF